MAPIAWMRKKTRLAPRAVALKMASAGGLDGTVVQGTSRGSVLEFSAILRPHADYGMGLLALIAAFCASEGIRRDTGIMTWIRWPDEVVADGKVLASTSLVSVGSPESVGAVLNFRVNHGRVRTEGSTSLEEILGVRIDPDLLVTKTMESLSWMYSGWLEQRHPQILNRIGSMLENAGKTVSTKRGNRREDALVVGVDEKGRLLLRTAGTGASTHVEPSRRIEPLP